MAEHLGPYFYGTGRRKTAVARVRLHPNGDGRIIVNGRDANEYFGRETLMMQVRAPMRLLELGPQFTISIKVVGGGVSGQAGAGAGADGRGEQARDAQSRLPDARPAHEGT